MKAVVRIACGDAATAHLARDALAPDNAGTLEAEAQGADLVLSAEAASCLGLLRTLDDALACLRAIPQLRGASAGVAAGGGDGGGSAPGSGITG